MATAVTPVPYPHTPAIPFFLSFTHRAGIMKYSEMIVISQEIVISVVWEFSFTIFFSHVRLMGKNSRNGKQMRNNSQKRIETTMGVPEGGNPVTST